MSLFFGELIVKKSLNNTYIFCFYGLTLFRWFKIGRASFDQAIEPMFLASARLGTSSFPIKVHFCWCLLPRFVASRKEKWKRMHTQHSDACLLDWPLDQIRRTSLPSHTHGAARWPRPACAVLVARSHTRLICVAPVPCSLLRPCVRPRAPVVAAPALGGNAAAVVASLPLPDALPLLPLCCCCPTPSFCRHVRAAVRRYR
jgi:hypothetical protein